MNLCDLIIGLSCIMLGATAISASATPTTSIPANIKNNPSLQSIASPSNDAIKPKTAKSVQTSGPSAIHPAPTNVYNYSANGANGTVCLLAKFGAQFRQGKNVWNVSHNATVDEEGSKCGVLKVKFLLGNFIITFAQNDKSEFFINEVNATLNSTGSVYAKNLTLAKASNGSSYRCISGLKGIGMTQNVTFHMSDVQLQPYFVKSGKFATAQNCDNDLSPVIPIIVGAILAGLVLIVIIAYFIGRSRNRVGYEEI